jgi:hypothetical protein
MEPNKLKAPVQLIPSGSQMRQETRLGCVNVFLGVFFALLALVLLAWGICFMEHIGHEQRIIDGIATKAKETNDLDAKYGVTDPEGELRETANLVELQKAAKNSQYDPFWFLDGAP